MATQPETGLTYEDLRVFPEDNVRRELIDGELIVSPSPSPRHQSAVARLVASLQRYADQHGGQPLLGLTDVYFSQDNVVEPDVLFVRADHLDRLEEMFIRGAPDLIVEVSSPWSLRRDLVRKRELYERFGVPEYWFVDLDADRVEVYRLHEGRYGAPELIARDDVVGSRVLPGFAIPAADAIPPA